MARLSGGAIPVDPPAEESQSNGSVENGVKLFKGLLRVHLAALERKVEGYIPSEHPLMSWLVEHVADIITKYLRGNDGRTGYERLYGKQVHEEGLEFGEKIRWKKRRKHDYNIVLDPRWEEGTWLGRAWGSITHSAYQYRRCMRGEGSRTGSAARAVGMRASRPPRGSGRFHSTGRRQL